MSPENKAKQRKKPVPPQGQRFKKGQSGNPGGRPKQFAGFKAACREFIERQRDGGWAYLERIARRQSKGVTVRDQLFALRMMAEYAYGKPAQPITGEEGGPIEVRVVYTAKAAVAS
jgi:hypothetical protein